MSRRYPNINDVNPEVIRKAQHLLEIYNKVPKTLSSLTIKTKVFTINYDRDGWLYLNKELYYRLSNQLKFFITTVGDIQGIEFTFDNIPNKNLIHSVFFDDEQWRVIGVAPKISKKFRITLTSPLQDNRDHRQSKKKTDLKTIKYVNSDQGPMLTVISKTYDFHKMVNGESLKLSIPLLGSNMIEQKFKGVTNALIIIKYVKYSI